MTESINDFLLRQFVIINPILFVLAILGSAITATDIAPKGREGEAFVVGLLVGYCIGVLGCGFNACLIRLVESAHQKAPTLRPLD